MSLQMLLVASKCSSSKTFACCDFVSGVKACGQANLWLNVSRKLLLCRVSGDKKSSLVGAIMDKVMPATVSRISSLTRRFWQRDETSESNRPTEVSPQAFSRGTHLRDFSKLQMALFLVSIYPSPGVRDVYHRCNAYFLYINSEVCFGSCPGYNF